MKGYGRRMGCLLRTLLVIVYANPQCQGRLVVLITPRTPSPPTRLVDCLDSACRRLDTIVTWSPLLTASRTPCDESGKKSTAAAVAALRLIRLRTTYTKDAASATRLCVSSSGGVIGAATACQTEAVA